MSIVWLSVFILLCIELIILLPLVVPLPNAVRRFLAKKILSFNLAPKIRFLVNFTTLGLIFAVWDAVQQLQHLEGKAKDGGENVMSGDLGSTGYLSKNMTKSRLFRAERNLYLAGFTLVLLFVIARMVELLQLSVDLEEQRDSLKQKLADRGVSASDYTSIDNESSGAAQGLRRRTNALGSSG